MNKGFIFLIGFFLSCSGGEKSDQKKAVANEEQRMSIAQNDLPTLMLTLQNGTTISAKDLKGRVALILFQPDCDHCQREAQEIQKNITGFEDVQLYFISSASMNEIIQFAKDYKLKGSNIHLAVTTVKEILDSYGPIDAPSIYLYGDGGTLIQSFNGEVAIEVVLKYI